MEQSRDPEGPGKTLFLIIASIIVVSILLFLIFRPGVAT
jgi:hypothetical protein